MIRIAHRGMNHIALQNTLPAFQAARDAGVDGIELDVQLAKCGTPMVFHDDELHDLFGMPGTVQDYSASELSAMVSPLATKFPEIPAKSMGVPRLSEVLELMKGSGMLINVEIKSSNVQWNSPTRATHQVMREYRQDFIVSCFNPIELVRMHRHDAGLPLALLFGVDTPHGLNLGWPAPLLTAMRLDAIHPSHELVSKTMVDNAHERGLRVNVWTVNNAHWAGWLEGIGVDGIISDVASSL